jgi:hypothetical protein
VTRFLLFNLNLPTQIPGRKNNWGFVGEGVFLRDITNPTAKLGYAFITGCKQLI